MIYGNEISYVLDLVWQKMGQNEGNEDFLRQCYVVPQAHADIVGLTQEIISRRRESDKLGSTQIQTQNQYKEVIRDKEYEKPIVVLGEIGHGKTTFLKYLRKVELSEVMKDYIQLEVDFIDQPRNKEEIEEYVIDVIEQQLKDAYNFSIYDDKNVRGVLYKEIQEFRTSLRGKLFQGNQDKYNEEELEWLEETLHNKNKYLQRVLYHLKSGQRKSIAIFFDNLDRRNDSLQEEAFLYASAIAKQWECLCFICLRPGTYYKSLSSGVLDSLSPKTIVVSNPMPQLLLKRRFEYAARIASGKEFLDKTRGDRFTVNLPTVANLFAKLEFSAQKNRGIIPLLEAVSNGNMRKLLDFTKSILVSRHLDTKKINEIIESENSYTFVDHEGRKTLLYGDYIQYDPQRSIFINLFDITHADPKEHFIRIITLSYLGRNSADGPDRGFLKKSTLVAYLESFGYTHTIIIECIVFLYAKECIVSPIAGEIFNHNLDRFRITSLGRYHIYNMVTAFEYIDAVIIDTPILDHEIRQSIIFTQLIKERIGQTKVFLNYLNECAKEVTGPHNFDIWKSISNDIFHDIQMVEERVKSI